MGRMNLFWLLFGQVLYRWDIVLLGLLFLLFVSMGSYGLGLNIRDKRKQALGKIVKRRTKELEKANAELKTRNEELDRFVYSASHDLSSPLKSILGLISVAKMEGPGPVQTQYLEMMEKSVNKLESFIGEVVQYSRNTRLVVEKESYWFKPLVEEILPGYRYIDNYDKVFFEVIDETGLPIITDGMRLRITLNNLISNAIKFHRVGPGMEPTVKISRAIESGHDVIRVEDNGMGIPPACVHKVFEMFFRGTESMPGSGLGLYILKEAVSKMNGRVDVKSKVGEGTVFTVTLPNLPDTK
ncbi:MAG: HAMP domain-containing histidine kinase [Cyclobacteriaceae bacterium]|nr:HAMP domain-containing histidine kinase [Cyclobacteriaceae bacterium]MCB0499656.1 HAMP domain-containing histidine kinase [Cyclobacteriaceae bacterium]MCB9239419.1 HAMP domain-containing histidine kinase [Flammeovirgaceae bacterium]MCO5271198.1 HAMP domain-containing histidine kinase [Cyclobacteriaceae bacterium]MCW5902596.1 HAMP domain-containing histidine kinase [Cyclobacteriaceae bacterium]